MSKIAARVSRADAEDGVVVEPLAGVDELRTVLRSATSGAARRRGGSYFVPFSASGALQGIEGLQWSPDAARAIENRTNARSKHQDVISRMKSIQAKGIETARALISVHGWGERLDDHQAINVAALTVPEGWGGCIFDEQGTGKTPTMIAVFDVLHDRNEGDVLIVVAPKSMLAEWAAEFDRFTGGLYRVGVATGTRHERAAVMQSGFDVVIVNYETVVTMIDNLKLIAKRARAVLAVDESFFVKNPHSARSTAVAELREWCTRAYVLCGTPAPNSPHDLVAQIDLVDFGLTFTGLRVSDDRDAAALEIKSAIAARGFYTRNLKQVALPHLPGRRFSEVRVEMEADQRAAYEAALRDLILDLRGVTEDEFKRHILSFMERRAALLRICADPSALIPGYSEVPAKILALDAILAEYVDQQNEKIIIWSFYRRSLDRIAARYERYGLVRIDGSVTDIAARRDAVRRFQDDEGIRVFVGNPAAAGAGLTLHTARLAVYESLSNQAAHFLQSLDRIHRRGQLREVEYITLLCAESIEEIEYARLLGKADRQAELLGDVVDDRITRTMLLDELVQSSTQASP